MRPRLLRLLVVTCLIVSASPSSLQAEEPTVRLAAVGDLMLSRSIGAALQRNPRDTPFAAVAAPLLEADVTVGNLECAIGTGGRPAPKAYTFLAPPAAAVSLRDAGFDLVSLANNHSLDFGTRALSSTLDLLAAQGILTTGAGMDESTARRPALMEVNGLKLAFLGYVDVPIERGGFNTASWRATAQRPGVVWADPRIIAADVAAAREQADVVVVLLHSGYEDQATPNPIQRRAARAAIDAGAALVLGAHPHVLQGVERYNGGVIAYSLGNFVFDGLGGPRAESAILNVTLSREGVQSFTWTPVALRAGRPTLASGQQARAILAKLERLSAALNR